MTNHAHTYTNANTDTEHQSMIAHLEAAQRKLLTKYGMTFGDVPTLLRGLANSFDGSRPEMDRDDERLFLIYIGMMETQKSIEAIKELIRAQEHINSLHEEIDGLHRHIDCLYETGQFDDEEDADDNIQELGIDAPANDNRQGLYPVT